jgi:hypothetical protein
MKGKIFVLLTRQMHIESFATLANVKLLHSASARPFGPLHLERRRRAGLRTRWRIWKTETSCIGIRRQSSSGIMKAPGNRYRNDIDKYPNQRTDRRWKLYNILTYQLRCS